MVEGVSTKPAFWGIRWPSDAIEKSAENKACFFFVLRLTSRQAERRVYAQALDKRAGIHLGGRKTHGLEGEAPHQAGPLPGRRRALFPRSRWQSALLAVPVQAGRQNELDGAWPCR